jgi:nucleotide-binding universal stress UspA family protein
VPSKEFALLPIHTILFPTDFSETAQQAFPLACALARDCGARLVVLYVLPPPVGHEKLEARRDPHEYYGELWQALRTLQAPNHDVRVEHRLVEGDATKRILEVAQEMQAGLILMGTHGRTGLGRLLLGSVAEQVLRRAACPVLTVRIPFPAEPTNQAEFKSGD